MKKLLSVLTLLTFFLQGSAQNYSLESIEFIDRNEVKALFNSGGLQFFSDTLGAQFLYPTGTNQALINSCGLWVGGLDSTGQLHLAAMTYNLTGRDYFPGPMMDTAVYSSQFNTWNRLWKLNSETIDSMLMFQSQPWYTYPDAILNWPAHGNTSLGQSPVLAPYADVSGDWTYSPTLGDYPFIRGDQCVYSIFNDAMDIHTQSTAPNLGIEIHAMAYEIDSDPLLAKVLFVNYLIINRTSNDYDSVFAGLFTDFDLGDKYDDYLGCDSTENMFFAYNGSDPDAVYGVSPPVIGVKFLNRTMSGFRGFFNGGNWIYNSPSNVTEYYLALNSYLNDTTRMHRYEGGHPNSGSDSLFTNFMFNGHPFDTTYGDYSEVHYGNDPGDRLAIANVGPFPLRPNEVISLDVAFIVADSMNQLRTVRGNIDLLYSLSDYVQDYFDQHHPDDGSDLLGVGSETNTDRYETIAAYPNPVRDIIHIKMPANSGRFIATVRDVTGRTVTECPDGQTEVNVRSLEAGVYFLSIKVANRIIIRKFVKL